MDTFLTQFAPLAPQVILLGGALLCGMALIISLGRRGWRERSARQEGSAANAEAGPQTPDPEGGDQAFPRLLADAPHMAALAWRARDVWAGAGLTLDIWGGRTGPIVVGPGTTDSALNALPSGHPAAGPGGRESPRMVELFVRGEGTHVRAATRLAAELAAALEAEVQVGEDGPGRGVVRVRETGTSRWRPDSLTDGVMMARARAILAPLGTFCEESKDTLPRRDGGSTAGAVTLYGEVHRGLLVVGGGQGDRASELLLAVTGALLASLPRGSVDLLIAASPLSPLRALSTASEFLAPLCAPDVPEEVQSLLDRATGASRRGADHHVAVVLLEDVEEAVARSEELGARLATAVAQGPGRGVVVLASTRSPGALGEALSAFTCRLLLGPRAAADAACAPALLRGIVLPVLADGEALYVDRREGAAVVVRPVTLDAASAARVLGLPPAPLDLADAHTTDAPRVGPGLVEVRLLGQLAVGPVAGPPLRPRGGWRRQCGELVAYLAAHWDRAVPLGEIGDALCASSGRRDGDDDKEDAAGGLVRAAQAALARVLGPAAGGGGAPLLAGPAGITLNTTTVWVDSVAFAALCHAAGAARGERTRVALLERALALYGGDFLGDRPAAAWAEAERARLRTLYHTALGDCARGASRVGAHSQACSHARRLVQAMGDGDEEATLLLLEVLTAAGDAAGLCAAYDAYLGAVGDAHGEAPAWEVRAAFEGLTAGLPAMVSVPGRRSPGSRDEASVWPTRERGA